jgi:hypothetical protein
LAGCIRPPGFLALLLVVLLGVVWAFAVLRFLGADAWGDDSPKEKADSARSRASTRSPRGGAERHASLDGSDGCQVVVRMTFCCGSHKSFLDGVDKRWLEALGPPLSGEYL